MTDDFETRTQEKKSPSGGNKSNKKASWTASLTVKTVAVFVAFIAGITIFAQIVVSSMGASSGIARNELYKLRTVETVVQSSRDGQEYKIQAKVTVAMKKNIKSKVTTKILNDIVHEASQNLDYDKLTDTDSVEYMENELFDAISQHVSPEDIAGVYVTDMSTGSQDLIEVDPVLDNPKNDKLKGIFKGMN